MYLPVEASSGPEWYYIRSSWHLVILLGQARIQSDVPPSRGIWWPRVVWTWVPLIWPHVLLSAIDHLQFSTVLCNRLSSFLICNPQCPTPLLPPDTPLPVRHLVAKSGTTSGEHDMSPACGSGWCFVRCTPSLTPNPHMSPQYPHGRAIWWPRMVLTSVQLISAHVLLSTIDHLEFSRVLCNSPSSYFICNLPIPPNTPIPLPAP